LQFAVNVLEPSKVESEKKDSSPTEQSLLEKVCEVSQVLKIIESMLSSEEKFEIPERIKELYSFQERIASFGSDLSEIKSDVVDIEALVESRNNAMHYVMSKDILQIIEAKELELISLEEKIKHVWSHLEVCRSKLSLVKSASGAFVNSSTEESGIEDVFQIVVPRSESAGVIDAMKKACEFYVGRNSLYQLCSTIKIENLEEFALTRSKLDFQVSIRKDSFVELETKANSLNERISVAMIRLSKLLNKFENRTLKARSAYEERYQLRLISFKKIVGSARNFAENIQNQLSQVQTFRAEYDSALEELDEIEMNEREINLLQEKQQQLRKKRKELDKRDSEKLKELLSRKLRRRSLSDLRQCESALWKSAMFLPELCTYYPKIFPLAGTCAESIPIRNFNEDHEIEDVLSSESYSTVLRARRKTDSQVCVLKRVLLTFNKIAVCCAGIVI
jgi:hypothetical protein